jgi:hypothetical protein
MNFQRKAFAGMLVIDRNDGEGMRRVQANDSAAIAVLR